jgi:hypothetical protein
MPIPLPRRGGMYSLCGSCLQGYLRSPPLPVLALRGSGGRRLRLGHKALPQGPLAHMRGGRSIFCNNQYVQGTQLAARGIHVVFFFHPSIDLRPPSPSLRCTVRVRVPPHPGALERQLPPSKNARERVHGSIDNRTCRHSGCCRPATIMLPWPSCSAAYSSPRPREGTSLTAVSRYFV